MLILTQGRAHVGVAGPTAVALDDISGDHLASLNGISTASITASMTAWIVVGEFEQHMMLDSYNTASPSEVEGIGWHVLSDHR